jgi:hypothetical protein
VRSNSAGSPRSTNAADHDNDAAGATADGRNLAGVSRQEPLTVELEGERGVVDLLRSHILGPAPLAAAGGTPFIPMRLNPRKHRCRFIGTRRR